MTAATPNAQRLIDILRDHGMSSYETPRARVTTDYMERMRLPTLQPIAVERNRVTPNLWIDACYMQDFAARGLACERYEAARGRHSGLAQIREFEGTDLVKVKASDPIAVVDALRAIAARRNAA